MSSGLCDERALIVTGGAAGRAGLRADGAELAGGHLDALDHR
jgi:hypothetical protein